MLTCCNGGFYFSVDSFASSKIQAPNGLVSLNIFGLLRI